MQIVPPALAWLWRLVAPRGFKNPSISGETPLASEGVGSYWPFATGKRVTQANLLLEQIISCPNTRYVLIPNQHIGSYRVGFAAEWIAREYLARRGGVVERYEQKAQPRALALGGKEDEHLEDEHTDDGDIDEIRRPGPAEEAVKADEHGERSEHGDSTG